MPASFRCHLWLTLVWALRDRILHAVLGASLLLLFLVPVFSSFSLRNVQETALTLALSATAMVLLILAVQLGSSSIYRDIERRYTTATLALPVTRRSFLLGRFAGIALVLLACAVIFAALTVVLVPWTASINPSDRSVVWSTVFLAVGFDLCVAILLAAFALMLSCVSTSMTLPFFCSIGLYLAGSASQEVYDYLHGPMGGEQPYFIRYVAETLYYLIPNFSAFDLHIQAIYGLSLEPATILTTFGYFGVYTTVLVAIGILLFNRRELP